MKSIKFSVATVNFAFIFLFYSCTNTKDPIKRINEQLQIKSDSIAIQDVPRTFKENDLTAVLFRKRVKSLGLPSLETGIDGFQLRVWEDRLQQPSVLYIINYTNNTWTASGCLFEYRSTDGSWPDSLEGKVETLGDPKSGWKNLINKILDYGVLDLNDYHMIPGYFAPTDANVVTVEISCKKYYKYIDLPVPEHQPSLNKDAERVTKILHLLRQNFIPKSLSGNLDRILLESND